MKRDCTGSFGAVLASPTSARTLAAVLSRTHFKHSCIFPPAPTPPPLRHELDSGYNPIYALPNSAGVWESWETRVSRTTGAVYYKNLATGEKTFDLRKVER